MPPSLARTPGAAPGASRRTAGRRLRRRKSLAPGGAGPGTCAGVPDRLGLRPPGSRRGYRGKLGIGREAITATSFALAVAAVWLGCSIAVAELAGGGWPGRRREADVESFIRSLSDRVLAVLVSVCALGCALLLAIVYWGAGSKVRGCPCGVFW